MLHSVIRCPVKSKEMDYTTCCNCINHVSICTGYHIHTIKPNGESKTENIDGGGSVEYQKVCCTSILIKDYSNEAPGEKTVETPAPPEKVAVTTPINPKNFKTGDKYSGVTNLRDARSNDIIDSNINVVIQFSKIDFDDGKLLFFGTVIIDGHDPVNFEGYQTGWEARVENSLGFNIVGDTSYTWYQMPYSSMVKK